MEYLLLFFIYSFFGVGIEVFFTSIHDFIRYRDLSFKGRSYLWMFPIYGSLGLVIGPLYRLLLPVPFLARGLVYMVIIFSAEFGYGYLLKLTLGKCPWEYKSRWAIKGVVKVTYLPFWLAYGYIAELLYRGFKNITVY
ncbi:MAG: putative ABC transporter permease [Actinomycetota bacterium]